VQSVQEKDDEWKTGENKEVGGNLKRRGGRRRIKEWRRRGRGEKLKKMRMLNK